MATPPFKRTELPKTLARQKWAGKLRVGPDISDIIGFGQAATDLATVNTGLLTNTLQDVGSVENVEVIQNKSLLERYAFGPNPQQPFQIIPQQVTVTLRLTKVVLKNLSVAEKVFNFYPANLLYQQLPFVIQLRDAGDGEDTAIDHFLFGCWFADTAVKYDVGDKADTRLIQSATVKVSRMLTLDQTSAGSPGAITTRAVFSGIQTVFGNPTDLIDELDL